jgi:phospholipase C
MKTSGGDIEVPLKEAGLVSDSLGHQHHAFQLEYDHGKMDGFGLVDRVLRKGRKVKAGLYTYRYVSPTDIQPYWQIAQQYVLGDHMFTTQSSSSFTAHQDLVAAGTPVGNDNVIDFPTPAKWGCSAPPGTVTSLITPKGRYLRDKGPFPCFTYSTIRDLLDARSVSWLYFTNTSRAYVWNAFDAIHAVRYGSEWTKNIVIPQTAIFQTITNGQLPAVSWVIPDAIDSDHPEYRSDSGPSWVASVVNAVGQSNYWQSTAIIVVWDDWGGEYDHVPPPQLDGQGLGMRVPMLLVSAFARKTSPSQPGYVSHTQYEFGSILKFLEDNWMLGTLGRTDARANSIIDCFDFTQPPRSFIPITAKYSKVYFERRPASGLPVDTE